MTNPKRPESLDEAIKVLEFEIARHVVRFPWDRRSRDKAALIRDALDVLRAERERRRGQ